MAAYYNEIDAKAAATLRELIMQSVAPQAAHFIRACREEIDEIESRLTP